MRSVSVPPESADPRYTPYALLPLKLHAPPIQHGALLRPGLHALLSESRLSPVTLVVAPAGYGKTTLLSQWAHDLQRTSAQTCWLTLDSSDRNPALFLAYLIGAFQSVIPSVGVDAWRVLHSAANLERDWPLVAGALCSDLQRSLYTPTFIVLDDVHLVIDSAVICQILGYVLRAVPPTLHIIMAARRLPMFAPLPRLRTEARIVEITQRDLHLYPDEVRHILALQDVVLSEDDLLLLLQRTDGWALSVRLAARVLASQPPERRSAFVRGLDGSHEQLLNYLASEVLADLPEELIEFLRLAALPVSFDAALLTEALERDDAAYLLQRAQSLGLPIMPMDERGDRLRFHPLWREVLLRALSTDIDQAAQAALHRRFGFALERRGAIDAALDHYASAGATGDLTRTLRECAWPLIQSPQRDVVHRWMERIAPDVRDRDAHLLHLWGISHAKADPAAAIEAVGRAAELYRQAGLVERELRAYADVLILLTGQALPTDCVAICVSAIEAANRARNEWSRGAARVCVVAILYSKGRDLAALRVARYATALPLYPAWRWLLTLVVSSIHCRLGRPTDALSAIDETLSLPQVDLDDRLRQSLLRLRALALFQQGQVVEATALALDVHQQLRHYYAGDVVGISAAQLALMLVLQQRVDEAMTYIAQARTIFDATGNGTQLATLQAIEVYKQGIHGPSDGARIAVGSVLRRLQEAQPRQDLSLLLLLVIAIGESGEHERAMLLTRDLIVQMECKGYRLYLACVHLYHAFLAGRQDDATACEEALHAGWGLAAADSAAYLPMLPAHVVKDVAVAALHEQIAPEAVGRILRIQIPEYALAALQGVASAPVAAIRAQAARLLGNVGTTAAYTALRALSKDRDVIVRQAAGDALQQIVYRPPYTLRIQMLGGFAIFRGDREVRDRDWRSSKARQLLQFLITERGRQVPRERILDMLWSELDEESAGNNLRVTLNRLSKAIEPDRPDGAPSSYILQHGDAYAFNMQCDHRLDAADFDTAVTEAQRADGRGLRQAAIAAFRRAVAYYNGPYLPEAMYEEWTTVERERLAMLFNDSALCLGVLLLDEGAAHESIGLAWRVLEYDRSHEEAYQLLMRAHAHLGERSTALRLYERCVSALRSELGVDPMPQTVAIYQSLREMR
jgi:ATP/maltotriose-dependent transcriptional regulator MalT/DNA-binding SARP family transcriptional activator